MKLSISKIQELTRQPQYKILNLLRDNSISIQTRKRDPEIYVIEEHQDDALTLTAKYLL